MGLDVYEEEPKIHPKLLESENAVLLPHVGTATVETQVSSNCTGAKPFEDLSDLIQRAMELLVLENIRSALTKGCLITQVPEQQRHGKL